MPTYVISLDPSKSLCIILPLESIIKGSIWHPLIHNTRFQFSIEVGLTMRNNWHYELGSQSVEKTNFLKTLVNALVFVFNVLIDKVFIFLDRLDGHFLMLPDSFEYLAKAPFPKF